MGRLVALGLTLAATLVVAACGSSAPQPSPSVSGSSGIYGVTLVSHGGRMTAPPTPSPLPGGLGMGELVPCPKTVVVVKICA